MHQVTSGGGEGEAVLFFFFEGAGWLGGGIG